MKKTFIIKASIFFALIVLLTTSTTFAKSRTFIDDLDDLSSTISNSNSIIIGEYINTDEYSYSGSDSNIYIGHSSNSESFIPISNFDSKITVLVKKVIKGDKDLKKKEIKILASDSFFSQKDTSLGSTFIAFIVDFPKKTIDDKRTYALYNSPFSLFPENDYTGGFSLYESDYTISEEIPLKDKFKESFSLFLINFHTNLMVELSTI